MHLQVTLIAGGLHPAPHCLPQQVILPPVQGGQPLRPRPAGLLQLPEQPPVPAEPRMELSAMPVRALQPSQDLNIQDANRVIPSSRTRRVPRLLQGVKPPPRPEHSSRHLSGHKHLSELKHSLQTDPSTSLLKEATPRATTTRG